MPPQGSDGRRPHQGERKLTLSPARAGRTGHLVRRDPGKHAVGLDQHHGALTRRDIDLHARDVPGVARMDRCAPRGGTRIPSAATVRPASARPDGNAGETPGLARIRRTATPGTSGVRTSTRTLSGCVMVTPVAIGVVAMWPPPLAINEDSYQGLYPSSLSRRSIPDRAQMNFSPWRRPANELIRCGVRPHGLRDLLSLTGLSASRENRPEPPRTSELSEDCFGQLVPRISTARSCANAAVPARSAGPGKVGRRRLPKRLIPYIAPPSQGPRGGVVTQRSAKPFTPVQFWSWPPFQLIEIFTAFFVPDGMET